MSTYTVQPWIEKISDQLTMQVRSSLFCRTCSWWSGATESNNKVAVQDLIDTPLDEALAKLEARVAENEIAIAVQAIECHKGALALQQHLEDMSAFNRYRQESLAKFCHAREEMLLRKRVAKRAKTQIHF